MLEIKYIEEFNTYYLNGQEYNMTKGGDAGSWTYDITESHKEKIRKALLGRKPNPESLEKAKETRRKNQTAPWNKGLKLSENQKKNMGPKKRQNSLE